jgi:hypothetical protein
MVAPTPGRAPQDLTKSEVQSPPSEPSSDSSTLGTKMNEKGELESTGERSEQETQDIKNTLDI